MFVTKYKEIDNLFRNNNIINFSFYWKENIKYAIFIKKINFWMYSLCISNSNFEKNISKIIWKNQTLITTKKLMEKLWFKKIEQSPDLIIQEENKNLFEPKENMKKFVKYRSITNTSNEESLNYFIERMWTDMECVAFEKIHGANLSFILFNDNSFTFSTRNEEINLKNSFYNFQIIFESLKYKFIKIWEFLRKNRKDIVSIQFIWEIFWGSYPNSKTNNAIKVQGEKIYYCPQNDWNMFDIVLNTKESLNNKSNLPFEDEYIDFKLFKEIYETFDIPVPPFIWKWSLDSLLKIDIEKLESQVYKQYNLPKIENNIVEGIVIKPIKNLYSWSHRIILKYKTKRFSEQKNESHNKNKKHRNNWAHSLVKIIPISLVFCK